MAPHHPQPPVIDPGMPQLAGYAAEALRDLNHLTHGRDAFADPAELSRLLAELAVMASRLPQLLDQLRSWLHHEWIGPAFVPPPCESRRMTSCRRRSIRR